MYFVQVELPNPITAVVKESISSPSLFELLWSWLPDVYYFANVPKLFSPCSKAMANAYSDNDASKSGRIPNSTSANRLPAEWTQSQQSWPARVANPSCRT